MAKFLDLCEKYFGACNFYEILEISKTSNSKEVKKAYYKLSLLVHPDRVPEEMKIEATEKFKVLSLIHSVLSDKDKRKIYDETGQFDYESNKVSMYNWSDYWRNLFKEITIEDINTYEKSYKGSEIEVKDLKRAYLNSKGSMDYIIESVPFTNCEEEARIQSIIKNLIEKGEIPEYKSFTQENEQKKLQRKRKWEKEAKIVEKCKEQVSQKKGKNCKDDVAVAILNKNKNRAAVADSFFDNLMNKYSKEAESSKKKVTTKK